MPEQPLKVVIVDDDDRFRMAVAALLASQGFEVVGEATNGQAAVEIVFERKPDVVAMDIDMPVLDGVAATRLIRAVETAPPVVMVTGSESSRRVHEALAVGAVGYVNKGRAAEELARVLREAAAAAQPQ